MAQGGGRRGSIWKNLLKKKEGKGRQRYDREEESESFVLGGRRPDGVPPDNGGGSRIWSGGRCRRWMEHYNLTGE